MFAVLCFFPREVSRDLPGRKMVGPDLEYFRVPRFFDDDSLLALAVVMFKKDGTPLILLDWRKFPSHPEA